jgi:hypothetical protein
MSSYLFSPSCLDSLRGVLDFISDVKPFRTKVVQAAVTIAFTDAMQVSMQEELFLEIEQLFHAHRSNCRPPSSSCPDGGFEAYPFEDDLGLEANSNYNTMEIPLGAPVPPNSTLFGYSAHGNPVYIIVPPCPPPEPACYEGYDVDTFEEALFESTTVECEETCNHAVIGPCITTAPNGNCAEISPTTISTVFTEFLLIEDGAEVVFELGSTNPAAIYTYDPTFMKVLPVTVNDGELVFNG